MKRLYLRIVDHLKGMRGKKSSGDHIESIPYYRVVHPKQSGRLCTYYNHNHEKLEKHCKEMECNGKTLYFCWTKYDGPVKSLDNIDDERISRR